MNETRAFLTATEFARALQITPEAVRRMCRLGILKAAKTPGGTNGHWRIQASELHRWQTGFKGGGRV